MKHQSSHPMGPRTPFLFGRFLSALLIISMVLTIPHAYADTLRVSNAGQEENPVRTLLETELSADQKADAETSLSIKQAVSEEDEDENEFEWRMPLPKQAGDFELNEGFLSDDHPAVRVVSERLNALLPDLKPDERPQLRVLASRGQGIQALMFEDGTLVVSPELVDVVEYEEELDFVLLHEINHWHRKHIKQTERLLESGGILTAVVRSLGLDRYQEYESDMAAFWGLLDRRRSGLGAVIFMERLEKERLEKKRIMVDWDLAHGTMRDRILNMKSLIPLVHMQYLDAPLHPMDPSVRQSLSSLPIEGLMDRLMRIPSRQSGVQEKHLEALEPEIRALSPELRLQFIGYAVGLMDQAFAHALTEMELRVINLDSERNAAGDVIWSKEELRRLSEVSGRVNYAPRAIPRFLHLWNETVSGMLSGVSPEVAIFLNQLLYKLNMEGRLYNILEDQTFEGLKEVLLSETDAERESVDEELLQIKNHLLAQRESYLSVLELPKLENALEVLENPVSRAEWVDRLGRMSRMGAGINAGLSFMVEQISSTMAQRPGRDFLSETGELLAAFRDLMSRSEVLRQETVVRHMNRVWTQLFMRQAALLHTEAAGLEEGFHKTVAEVARRHGFQEDVTGIREELRVHPEMKPWVGKYFDAFTQQESLFRRLDQIEEDLSKIDVKDRKAASAPYQILLLEAANLLNGVPEIVPVEGELRKRIDRAEFKIRYLNRVVGLRVNYRDFTLWGPEQALLPDPISMDDLRFLVGWWASVAEDSREYQEGVKLLSQKEQWMDHWKKVARVEEVNALADTLTSPSEAAQSIGTVIHSGLAGSQIHSEEIRKVFYDLAQEVLERDMAQAKSEEVFFGLLDGYAQRWPVRPNAEVVRKGVQFLNASKSTDQPLIWQRRLLLSFFASDPLIRRQLGEYSVLQIVQSERVSFDDAYALLFERYKPQGTAGGLRALRALLDRAHTYPELDRLKEAGADFLKFLQSSLLAGGAVLAEGGVEHWLDVGDRSQLFRSLMASGQDDWLLRRQVASYWTGIYSEIINSMLMNNFERDLRYWDDADEIEDWSGRSPSISVNRVSPFELAMDRIYMLGDPERYAMLRKLLADEDGILRRARHDLLDAFLNQHLDSSGEERAAEVVSEVLGTVLKIMPEDDLFLLVAPLLMDRIGNPPESPAEPAEASVETEDWSRRIALRLARSAGLRKGQRQNFVETMAPALERKFSWFLRGHGPDVTPDPGAERDLFSVVPPEFYQNRTHPMSPLEMTLETARQLGAPGVRFLQLVGQTVRLPEDYRKQFLTVYDNVEGQSLLSVAETIRNLLPEYAGRIQRFVRRLGGGSIYTVWEVEVVATEEEYPGRAGELVREAVRVVNPNALYRSRKSVQVIRDALTQLAQEQPQSGYALALPMVDLLEEWIAKELEDTSFEADDQEFRSRWNGWAPEGFQKTVVVPRTLPTGIPEIRRAEFLPGESFTSLDSLENAEQRELVALASHFYFQQVVDSVQQVLSGQREETLILSDISVGNFLRTSEGHLGDLDRGMFLKFNRTEAGVLMNFSFAATVQQRAEVLISHLWTLDLNQASSEDLAQRGVSPASMAAEIAGGLDPVGSMEKTALDVILGIQNRGLRVPLQFQLLFKNFNALREIADGEMSPQARFGSLEAALQYLPTAGQEENGTDQLVNGARGQLILYHRFRAAATTSEALKQYGLYEAARIKPRLEKILSSAALGGLKYAVINLMEHGNGGDLEIFLTQPDADGISRVTVRLADDGPGIADPRELLARSIEAHSGVRASRYEEPRGYGWKNIAAPSAEMTVESGHVKWRLFKEANNLRFKLDEEPSDVSKGTVITVVYESTAAGQEETTWKGPTDPVDAVTRLVNALIAQGYKGEQRLTLDRTSTLLKRSPTQQALSLNPGLVAEMNSLLKRVAAVKEPRMKLLKPVWTKFHGSELAVVIIQKGPVPVRTDPVEVVSRLVDALIAQQASGERQLALKQTVRLLNGVPSQATLSRNSKVLTRINELLEIVAADEQPSEPQLIPAWEKFHASRLKSVVIAKEVRTAGQEESIWEDISQAFGISKDSLLERLSERDRNQLRRATDITAPKMIVLYARIFGVSIPALQQTQLAQRIVAARIVTEKPMPARVRRAYDSLERSLLDSDIDSGVRQMAQNVREELAELSSEDPAVRTLRQLVQPKDYSQQQETILERAARWVAGALDPESQNIDETVADLRAITSSHSIEQMAKVLKADQAFSLGEPWRLKALLRSLLQTDSFFFPARFSGGRIVPLLVVVDSDSAYPLPRFAGNAAHEYAHALLIRRPFWKEQVTGTSMADWITQAVELLAADRIALENSENPDPYLSVLYREGERLALQGSSSEWESMLRELDQFPDSKRWYLQGVFIGGLAKGLGKRAADQTARSAEPFAAHELGLRFISSLADAIAESGGRSPIEVLIKTAQGFPEIAPAGQEERQVLRFYPDQGGAKIIAEQGTSWTPLSPVSPQRLILPNDPGWRLAVEEPRLRQLAEFLFQQFQTNIAQGYPLQTGDRNIVEAIRAVYPIPGLEPYEGMLTQSNFMNLIDLLDRGLFLRAGASIQLFAGGKIAAYITLDLPWQEISYLGGRASTWLVSTKLQIDQRDPYSFIYGSSFMNLSLYDPAVGQQAMEFQYQEFLSKGKSRGVPPAALQLMQQLHDRDPVIYQRLFGVDSSKQEEINHARDFVWAAYFYPIVVDAKEGATQPFVAEAVIRPDSFLDRTVWNRSKRRASDLVFSARNIVELSGQTQGLVDTLQALRDNQGEDWAYGYFWLYLFQKTEERLHRPGTVAAGHDRTAAESVFDFLKGEGFADLQQIEDHLRMVPNAHGSRALGIAQRLHDENFLTEAERVAILEKSERGELVSLGVRQTAAGQEENAVQAITADEIRARFADISVQDGETGYLVPAAALTQVSLYAHQSLVRMLSRVIESQGSRLPNVRVALKEIPARPGGLKTPGVLVWDVGLLRPYEQTLLPELELDSVFDDAPDLPALVLMALQGPGAELRQGIALYTIKEAKTGNEYYLFV